MAELNRKRKLHEVDSVSEREKGLTHGETSAEISKSALWLDTDGFLNSINDIPTDVLEDVFFPPEVLHKAIFVCK